MPLPEVLCADTARTPIVSVKDYRRATDIAIAAILRRALMHDLAGRLAARRGKGVGAISTGLDAREAMVFFEEIVAFFEIAPESDQRGLAGVRCCQCFQAGVRQPGRENLDRQMSLSEVADLNSKPINLFDPIIRYVNAQEEIALRVEPIQFVKALRHLFVPEAALGSQSSRRRANLIFVYELVRLVFRIRRPKLQEAFLFEGSQQNGTRRVSEGLFLESLPQDFVFFIRRCLHARVLPLKVAKGFRFLRRRGNAQQKEER